MRTLGRRLHGEDEGFALASVIAMMLLGALIVTIMLTATMRSIGSTTATRASVQAKAAAQAGVDAARSILDGGTCTSGTITGTNPAYTVTLHPSTGQNATASLPIACPTSTSRSVMVVSNGTATNLGTGNTSGNARAVESLLVKPGDSPRFDKAAFGLTGVNANTGIVLTDGTATKSADIFTEGSYTCSTGQVIEGDLYAKAGVLFSSGPCKVQGTVLTNGDFKCAAGTTIEGDLFVGGNADFTSQPCDVRGTVHVGGNVTIPNAGTPAGSTLMARGNLSVSGALPDSITTITLGGTLTGTETFITDTRARWGSRLSEHATVAVPPSYPTDAAAQFPKVLADDPAITTGFVDKPWKATIAAVVKTSGGTPDPCGLNWGENGFPNPITINVNTRFDTRTECSGGLTIGMGITFELNADLVILTENFSQNGDVKFTSGDGKKHSVYIISPWQKGATTCSPWGSGRMQFTSGKWTQDPVTSVMVYSRAGIGVTIKNQQFYGQMYGCTLDLATSTILNYVPVGSVVDPSTLPWSLSYVRDRG
jgi:hypothetical protein